MLALQVYAGMEYYLLWSVFLCVQQEGEPVVRLHMNLLDLQLYHITAYVDVKWKATEI